MADEDRDLPRHHRVRVVGISEHFELVSHLKGLGSRHEIAAVRVLLLNQMLRAVSW